jgi:hypothetical protein
MEHLAEPGCRVKDRRLEDVRREADRGPRIGVADGLLVIGVDSGGRFLEL